MLSYLVLMILSAWLGISLFIDFLAIPTVFRNISSLEEAGQVGMIIFTAFNTVEVLFGLFVVVFGWKLIPLAKKRFCYSWRLLLIICLLLAGIFRLHITPRIIQLTQEMHQYELESEAYKQVSKQHQFYHKGYVKLEGVKLVLMLLALILFFVQQQSHVSIQQREER